MGELVAITSAAVAVGDTLTTLIDWVNLEDVADFVLIVDNAGGGSGNDITDIQIDTSNDGGTTISTDQHAGVPAVPISAGNSKKGTFIESAAFIRVRGICAAGQDTTAEAYLLATSATGRICTIADVNARQGFSDTKYDTIIARIVRGVTAQFESHCHRPLLLNAAAVTEYYAGCGPRLQLDRYPIAAITSIKQATDYDFTNADALTSDTDYRLVGNGDNGIIMRLYANWFETEDAIQAIYRGGYCSAGQTPAAGQTAMPADLREAAIEQTSFIFKRRDDIGRKGESFDGGGYTSSPIDLLPNVKNTLEHYKKPSL